MVTDPVKEFVGGFRILGVTGKDAILVEIPVRMWILLLQITETFLHVVPRQVIDVEEPFALTDVGFQTDGQPRVHALPSAACVMRVVCDANRSTSPGLPFQRGKA